LANALSSYKFIIMYGQIGTYNQLIAAYFRITFTEWGWVFADGVWTITLSFALPLSRALKKLAASRPTASVLGLHTLSSALSVLVFNFLFVVIAFVALSHQEWYQCRKWTGTDVSNLLVIGDNYETEVLWLVTGWQIVNSAIVWNFGYEFRKAWIFNYTIVALVSGYAAIHFYITLVPSELSCFFRVNCVNENAFDGVFGVLPIQNDFNTTVMPEHFRYALVVIMIANTLTTVMWDYLVVNGLRRYFGSKRRTRERELRAKYDGQTMIQKDITKEPIKEEEDLTETEKIPVPSIQNV